MPGDNPALKKRTQLCRPFLMIDALARGTMREEEWVTECHRLGLSGPLLSPAMALASPALAESVAPAAPDDGRVTAARRRRRSW